MIIIILAAGLSLIFIFAALNVASKWDDWEDWHDDN